MYSRLLKLSQKPKESLFLWGPRKTGKTTLLKKVYSEGYRIDLLKSDILMRYLQHPSLFREEVMALDIEQVVIVDEIQKAPVLLDEVHYLIQEQNRVFVLCGSSARKVKKGHANLLGGRALKYELFGLCKKELDVSFNLERLLNTGFIPNHYDSPNAIRLIRSYVKNYLREEILQEGLVRRLPVFSDFLRVAAIGDTEITNLANIARETGVSAVTVREYYAILEDTLMGAFLPAYTRRQKRRILNAPKFYFRDLGVVNYLAKRGEIQSGSELFGKAFENWLFHELSLHSKYTEKFYDISYWKLTSGVEVDFILGNAEVAIVLKGKSKVTSNDYKGLLEFKKEHPEVKSLLIVCLEEKHHCTESGILIVPYSSFLDSLWEGKYI